MPSEWRVTSQFINGSKWYAVYRLKDINEVDHSGNREFYTGYNTDKHFCEELCKNLNEEAAKK